MPASQIAKDLDISVQHARRMWARHQKTADTRTRMGRPREHITEAQMRLVVDAHKKQPVGAIRIAKALRKNHDISYNRVYQILEKNGVVTASAAKSKRRKCVRYE